MRFSSACIPDVHKPEFHHRAKQSYSIESLLSIFAHILTRREMLLLLQLISSKDDLSAGQQLQRNELSAFDLVLQTFGVSTSSDPVELLLAHCTVEKGVEIPPITHYKTR